jgi:hypothetical protein
MSDINKLEKRIENLEFYTSLSLLENETLNMQITDADGLNRFKSGFFVDDFSDTENQIKKTVVKNSIDYRNGELRPSPYTTELDLKIDMNSLNGIRRTGNVLTLMYDEIVHVSQLYATRVENLTPYLVSYYGGTLTLTPDSDIWVDEVVLEAKNEDLTTYTENAEQLDQAGFDSRAGYGPVTWGAWNENWTGWGRDQQRIDTRWEHGQLKRYTYLYQTRTGTKERTGTRSLTKETFSTVNDGPKVINTEISSYMRSRNIKFDARTLKPSTGLYGFFDGQNISKYLIPKLLEISMTTGTFQVGETVIGTNNEGTELIRFQVAQANHKRGNPISPNEIYTLNPYYQFTSLTKTSTGTTLGAVIVDTIVPDSGDNTSTDASAASDISNIPELYSSTSVILNINLDSLAEKADNTYHGYVEKGLKLVGQTSNAQATISNLRLRSDQLGSILGSFFIPNPNNITTPKFDTGKKVFRLTTSPVNSNIAGNVASDVSGIFEASGSINTMQSTIISVKNIHTDMITRVESQSLGSDSRSQLVAATTIGSNGGNGGDSTPVEDTVETITVIGDPSTPDDNVVVEIGPDGIGGANATYIDVVPALDNQTAAQNWSDSTNYTPKISGSQNSHGTGFIIQTNSSGNNTVESNDPISNAYAQLGEPPPSEGAMKYWTASIAKEGITDPQAVQDRMKEHINWANARTEQELADFGEKHKDILEAHFEDIESETGLAQGEYDPNTNSSLKKNCGHGQQDPLAQSFWVPHGVGIYATRVDLYFGSKDQFLPCSVQLRTMQMGMPTTEIIPFGEVVLNPDQINVSDDASLRTTVRFPSPVYLPGGKSYALVLLSNSNEYTAWISRMGEVDVQTKDKPEAEQVVVSAQPTLGSLFKSQNGETWNASQYEDLKFVLYKARFNTRTGNVNFTNPPLVTQSDDIPVLLKDSLSINSNKIRIGFNTTISDTGVTIGNIISQDGSNATGRLAGLAGTANGNLTITNSGIGFTPSSGAWTYQNIALNTITGYGRNATANITITNGVASAATILSGGSGYVIGDVVGITSVGVNSLGRDLKFSIGAISGNNEFVLDSVQGDFATGVGKTIRYTTSAGIVTLNHAVGGNVWLSGDPSVTTDGLHIKVNQKNHGMYSQVGNVVTFKGIQSDISPTQLASDYDSTSTGSIIVDDATNFTEFENVGVGSTNLGYVKVGSEILSYSGVVNNTLTGVTRGVDSTQTLTHSENDYLHKYELNGVSLRRINTDHNTVNATVATPQGLDYFNVKVDMSANGVDRSVGTSLPKLHFNQTKSTGGSQILSTENIPFEVITPLVQNMTPQGTNVTGQIRTITGSSVDGSEVPYQDQGFEDISLISDNYMSTPRMIASRINETTSLPTLPDNKSFTLNLSLYGATPAVSPVIDLDRIGVILTSNRVNNPIDDWVTDNRVNTLKDDPNAFVYASKPVTLKDGASGLKIHLQAHINLTSEIRAFYAITEDPNDELIYQPFPGHTNLLATGQIIDPAKNNGLSDKLVPKTDKIAYTSDQVVWNDYEFTIDNLPTFRNFSIKLVGTGTNQAQPPRMKGLRVIALA